MDVGTFTGYSAIAIADALPVDGVVVTCEADPDVAAVAARFFDQRQQQQQQQQSQQHGGGIELKVGDAATTLQMLADAGQSFDFAFVDANKKGYVDYYEILFGTTLLSEGGIAVFDNVLWKDRAPAVRRGEHSPKESIAITLDAFNAHVTADDRTVQLCLPLDDGLMVCRRH